MIASRPSAIMIGASRYRRHRYGRNHPLDIPRVSLALDLIRSVDAITETEYVPSRIATDEELRWYHTKDYLQAMRLCETMGKVTDHYRQRHNIGNLENPWFEDFFKTPAVATGGSIQAAEALLAGQMAFSPAGGMHHARPDQARGFCFFNDAVLAVMRLRREGLRVLYVDLDAHHGDGVEYAFRDDPEAFTFSIHMDCSYAYPHVGGEMGSWGTHGNAINLPLPIGTNDSEYRYAFSAVWPAVLEAVRPQAIVLQAGTDAIMPDPLGKFHLSTQQFLESVEQVIAGAPRHPNGIPKLAVLGGGGYHPLVLARAWLGLWGLLSGRNLAIELPENAQSILRQVSWPTQDWDDDEEDELERAGTLVREMYLSRLDRPQEGEIRKEIRYRVETLLGQHPCLNLSQRPELMAVSMNQSIMEKKS